MQSSQPTLGSVNRRALIQWKMEKWRIEKENDPL